MSESPFKMSVYSRKGFVCCILPRALNTIEGLIHPTMSIQSSFTHHLVTVAAYLYALCSVDDIEEWGTDIHGIGKNTINPNE